MSEEKIKLITTKEASVIAGVSLTTIRRWIDEYGIGIKIVGRFKVDYNRLINLLQGDVKK